MAAAVVTLHGIYSVVIENQLVAALWKLSTVDSHREERMQTRHLLRFIDRQPDTHPPVRLSVSV